MFIYFETGIWTQVIASSNIGFSNSKSKKQSVTYLGYFQSYRWMENNPQALNQMNSLILKNTSQNLEDLINSSKNLKILGIHIRLGDYKFEPNIGFLTPQYYADALKVLDPKRYDEIWIFTNDEEESKSLLPELDESRKVWIPGILTSAETMTLMTYCTDFIISNSTFSWWGAFLNRNSSKTIICPEMWFKNMADPQDICPKEWVRVDGFRTERH
jgi:hypothetical protein